MTANLQEQINGLLTWERVRAWAEQQPEHCFVGRQELSHACPLACYLNEQPISGQWEVGVSFVSLDHTPATMPRWATRCVIKVDHAPLETERGEVDREAFLAILDECKPQEA